MLTFRDRMYTIPDDLDITLVKQLGEGEFGEVHSITMDGKSYAMKVRELATDFGNSFQKEVAIAQVMADHRIGPKIILAETWTSVDERVPEVGIIIMEELLPIAVTRIEPDGRRRFDIPLTQLKQVEAKILQMHDLGYVHADINPTNFMKRGRSVRLIDFGLSFNVDDAEVNLEELLLHNSSLKRINIVAQTPAAAIEALRLYDLSIAG